MLVALSILFYLLITLITVNLIVYARNKSGSVIKNNALQNLESLKELNYYLNKKSSIIFSKDMLLALSMYKSYLIDRITNVYNIPALDEEKLKNENRIESYSKKDLDYISLEFKFNKSMSKLDKGRRI